MNRLTPAINRTRLKIAELPAEKIEALEKHTEVTFEDHFQYQEMQARAHAMQKISQDEALIIYNALGEYRRDTNGGWTDGTDLATKVVITQMIGELAELQLAGRL